MEIVAVPTAHAIIIRDDVPDSEYVVPSSDYPALVDLFGPGDCIGTLVHESYLLTVAHCAVDLGTGQSLEVGGVPHAVAEVTLHPSWNDLDAFDIALVRLEDPVTGVEPLPIYRGADELGMQVSLVGRGLTATGLEGEDGGVDDGMLRRATNLVSDVDDHFLEVSFEQPGDADITDLEGVGAAGDSGCPVFVELDGTRYIAGLNSYGDAPAGIGIGQYGAADYQTRVSRYLDWLDGIVGSWPGDEDSGTGDSGLDDTGSDDSPTAGTGSDATGAGTDTTGPDAGQDDGGGCACGLGDERGTPLGVMLVLLAATRRRSTPTRRG